jgi:surface antigen
MGMLLGSTAQAEQCVTFAREQSGIGLKGDGWTWWASAAGHYDRGQKPRNGAVVVFKKHGSMSHGHVAVVTQVIGPRKLLVDHANWAPHRGRGRGQVTTQVMVLDVSPHNDWTQVRVWNEASHEMGQKIYPTFGFIYANAPRADARAVAASVEASAEIPAAMPGIELATDMLGDAAILPGLSTSLTSTAAISVAPLESGLAQ